jgi:hypothetical protein
MSEYSDFENKREITGWLKDGITSLPARMVGTIFRKFKEGQFTLFNITVKNKKRWFVSRVKGLSDVSRGFIRPATSSVMTGQVIRHNKLTELFNVIYGRVFQACGNMNIGSDDGRFYVADTDIELSTEGLMEDLYVGEEVVVYKIPAQFEKETLWEDITNDQLYDRSDG